MRRFLVFGSILALLFTACSSEEKISFVPAEPFENSCEDCPEITINLPSAQPETKPEAQQINKALSDFAISILYYTDEERPDSIPAAMEDFNLQYKELKENYPENIVPWEAKVKGEVSFRNEKIVSLLFDSYIFTGGAHGYGSTSFLNFDLATGEQLSEDDLLNNPKEFTTFVESIFRKQNNLKPEDNINSTGFMFEDDKFHLPVSIGFDEQGIILIYNPYEIASYADGQTKIYIPMDQAKPFIKSSWLEVEASS
ncbi:DUF3298 and DUF4163 domain-containing protein [Galbibacter sp.]|uniref:DUF3298 and DUF4163 domain-containing protein n=1 Tax=Galbibacter sp. TaxID=2918471 RepID=UPI003A908DCE